VSGETTTSYQMLPGSRKGVGADDLQWLLNCSDCASSLRTEGGSAKIQYRDS
jgi:hypothetical protein